MKKTPLFNTLQNRIASNGPITVAEYMNICLYDPENGYYTTQNPLGKEGDFITAPELSPLFGETLATWVAKQWKMLGEPQKFTLLEAGPGRGILMHDLLHALQKIAPKCLQAAHVYMLEISQNLRQIQQNMLKNNNITWVNRLEDAPFEDPLIFIANEFLDAFPMRQFVYENKKWFERKITCEETELKFILKETEETNDLNYAHINKDQKNSVYKDGIVETHEAANIFLHRLKQVAAKSAALFIDYGIAGGDTLQALKNHQFVDVFETPGLCDLTAHVDFEEVRNILGRAHCIGPQDMSHFLLENGFATRAIQAYEAEQDKERKEHLMSASQRLIDPNNMGSLFKVLVYIEN